MPHVIYRADPLSMFKSARLSLDYDDFMAPPPLPPPPLPAADQADVGAPGDNDSIGNPRGCGPSDDVVPNRTYGNLKTASALQFLKYQLHAYAHLPGRFFLSTRLPRTSVRTLTCMLALETAPSIEPLGDTAPNQAAIQDLLFHCQLEDHCWFSLVDDNPSQSKRAQRGKLGTYDIGIALHKVLNVVPEEVPTIVVSPTPWIYREGVGPAEKTCADVALILRLETLSLDPLLELQIWPAADDVVVSTTDDVESEVVPGDFGDNRFLVTTLMHAVLSSGAQGLDARNFSGYGDAAIALLVAWQAGGMVTSVPHGDSTRWTFTKAGLQHLSAGVSLSKPSKLLLPRSLPAGDLFTFELMMQLEHDGWECSIASTKDDTRRARATPYDPCVGNKKWWLRENISLGKFVRKYAVALLTASLHRQKVPHLASHSVYNKIIDPEWKPRKRKQLVDFMDFAEDDWDAGAIALPKRKARSGAIRAAEERMPWIRPEGPPCVGDSDKDSSSACSHGSDSNSGKSSESRKEGGGAAIPSSSSTSSSSSSDSGMKAPAAKANAKVKAMAQVKAGKAASSMPASSSSAPPAPAGAGLAVRLPRDASNREPYGLSTLTARFGKDGLSGWQMSCMNPQHKFGKRCTKELGNSVTGSSEATHRILKTWLLLGAGIETCEEHMSDSLKKELMSLFQACRPHACLACLHCSEPRKFHFGWRADRCAPSNHAPPSATSHPCS